MTAWATPHTWTTREVISKTLLDAISANLSHLKERDASLVNATGTALTEGDVLIQDTGTNVQAISTTTAGHAARVVVAMGAIAIAATGYFRESGYALVKVNGAVTRGSPLQTSTTAKRAVQGTVNPFAIALQANASGDATLPCLLLPRPADGSVSAGMLKGKLAEGHIPLSLTTARVIAANDIPNTAATGGLLTKDSAPKLERVNGATDRALRVVWAAGDTTEIQFDSFIYPADLDDASPVVIHLLAGMSGAADTPAIGLSFWEQIGDANAGGNTGALSSAITEVTRTIAAADIAAAPKVATVSIAPGAHATDAVYLIGAWATYSRTAN